MQLFASLLALAGVTRSHASETDDSAKAAAAHSMLVAASDARDFEKRTPC
ncbi:MAG: hypothetical protein ABJF01_11545 [bacterium]